LGIGNYAKVDSFAINWSKDWELPTKRQFGLKMAATLLVFGASFKCPKWRRRFNKCKYYARGSLIFSELQKRHARPLPLNLVKAPVFV
jgi:hypothetical protein